MKIPSKQFIEEFKKTQGALSVCESIAIYNIALQAPEGLYLELGSHKGKSGMSAALGLKSGVFHLVDPIFEDEELENKVVNLVQNYTNGEVFVEAVAAYSTDIIHNYDNLAFVFLDSGSHCDGLPMQEVKMLEDRIMVGGILAFHDFQNQFTEVAEAYKYLVSTGKYEPIEIKWNEIKAYVSENNLEEGNSSWHMDGVALPCFVGALKRKA